MFCNHQTTLPTYNLYAITVQTIWSKIYLVHGRTLYPSDEKVKEDIDRIVRPIQEGIIHSQYEELQRLRDSYKWKRKIGTRIIIALVILLVISLLINFL